MTHDMAVNRASNAEFWTSEPRRSQRTVADFLVKVGLVRGHRNEVVFNIFSPKSNLADEPQPLLLCWYISFSCVSSVEHKTR